MKENVLGDLKEARDYLFELYDDQEHEEIKLALRLVNREIRRVESDERKQQSATNNGKEWSKEEDDYLRAKLKEPTRTKEAAKQILVECSESLKRTDAETYSRIRTLGLQANLHAWGAKPKIQWQTMPTSANESDNPGLLHDFYQGDN